MEEEIQEYGGILFLNNNSNDNGIMTDEQMEVLRKQIAAYSTICEQLEELHRMRTHNNLEELHRTTTSYSLLGQKQQLSRRQRWNPTTEQLRILERVFDEEEIRTPNSQKVKEVAMELARHGQVAEPNVYNWFQNRRARLKKNRMYEAETLKVINDESAAVGEEHHLHQITNVSHGNGRMSWEGRHP